MRDKKLLVKGKECKSHIVFANNIRIHCVERGKGPLILMVHGFPESWYSWRHQLIALSDAGYRAVAIDMRGYGRSSKPRETEAYRITELVEDVIGIVNALGESKAVIFGRDWGAPVAWTAAWTRPDIFYAVAGFSIPFGGRGMHALPGNPWGEKRPSIVEREISGPDREFYQELFKQPGRYEKEFEPNVYAYLYSFYYNASASLPLPAEAKDLDFMSIPNDVIVDLIRDQSVCLPRGGSLKDLYVEPPKEFPEWLTEEDIDFYATEMEYTGIHGPLNYYRALDIGWELLKAFEGKTVDVPALYVGGDRDFVTLWTAEARQRIREKVPNLWDSVIIKGAGHWIQEEKPKDVNKVLLKFLADVAPVKR